MASEYVVERAEQINAAPEAVFPLINNLSAWQQWSPWEGLDPNMERTYDGEEGVGASYSWKGNKKVGEGRMTIAEASDPSKVVLDLEFLKPFKSSSRTTIEIQGHGEHSHVKWTMVGQHNWMSKLMGVFMNFDKMIGKDFEKGLSQLKTVLEK